MADRETVESASDQILQGADSKDIAFLVVGDPFGYQCRSEITRHPSDFLCRATTHSDLIIRARELNIPVQVIHNASIMSAIGATGLQLYNFGQAVSMVFFTDSWKPSSYYDRIKENAAIGLHTLLLLDIKVKEQSMENLVRGRKIYEPPRFMTVAQCAQQMLETEQERQEGVCRPSALAVGVARVGSRDQTIAAGTLEQLAQVDLGPPLHSLVLLGKRTHYLEKSYIDAFAVDKTVVEEVWKAEYEV